MSGHSKWSKIKRKKGASDAKRSKVFSRIITEITVAVKEGGSGDADFNPRLRMAVSNAKGANMPKDNVVRAIKKALESGSTALFQPTYEGYASGGIAVFVECTTDNINRTVSSVRATFNKRGGSMATNGSVDFLFERKGLFTLSTEGKDPEELELELIDGGAEDIEIDEEANEMHVTVAFEDFGNMQSKVEDLGMEAKSASLERIPLNTTELSMEDAKKALTLIEALEEDDDVQAVFHNLELTDEMMAEMMEE